MKSLDDVEMSYCADYVVIDLVCFEEHAFLLEIGPALWARNVADCVAYCAAVAVACYCIQNYLA